MQLKTILLLASLTLILSPSAYSIDLDIDSAVEYDFADSFGGLDSYDYEANYSGSSGQRTASSGAAVGCPNGVARTLNGEASYYGPGFHGRATFCGERFNQNELTAAVRQGTLRRGQGSGLRCGDRAVVTNRENGRRIVVRITDTGGLPGGRVLDLSQGAASRLGFIDAGHTDVTVQFCN